MKYMGDRELLAEASENEKYTGALCFVLSCECSDNNLKNDFLEIAKENAEISSEMTSLMHSRFKTEEESAPQASKTRALQKFAAEKDAETAEK